MVVLNYADDYPIWTAAMKLKMVWREQITSYDITFVEDTKLFVSQCNLFVWKQLIRSQIARDVVMSSHTVVLYEIMLSVNHKRTHGDS